MKDHRRGLTPWVGIRSGAKILRRPAPHRGGSDLQIRTLQKATPTALGRNAVKWPKILEQPEQEHCKICRGCRKSGLFVVTLVEPE